MQKQYVLTGGRNGLREKNGWPLQVREVEAADGTLHEFVRISRQDHWFLKTIGGAGTQKGGLSHLTFLDELTEAAVAAAAAMGGTEADEERVCATPELKGPSADDPMNSLDDLEQSAVKTRKPRASGSSGGPSKAKGSALRVWERVCDIQFRERPGSETLVNVSVLHLPHHGFHVRMDSLEWLLNFANASHERHGSEENVENPDGPVLGSSAVAGESGPEASQWRPRWAQSDEKWEGVVVSGPDKGKVVSCSLAEFTAEKYTEMRAIKLYPKPWHSASNKDKRKAALDYLEDRMAKKAYIKIS